MLLTAPWFIVPVGQLAAVGVATVMVWHWPQSIDPVGMCGGEVRPVAAEFVPLWQLAQPDVTPVWLKLVASFHVVKPVGVWQLEQSAPLGIAG